MQFTFDSSRTFHSLQCFITFFFFRELSNEPVERLAMLPVGSEPSFGSFWSSARRNDSGWVQYSAARALSAPGDPSVRPNKDGGLLWLLRSFNSHPLEVLRFSCFERKKYDMQVMFPIRVPLHPFVVVIDATGSEPSCRAIASLHRNQPDASGPSSERRLSMKTCSND